MVALTAYDTVVLKIGSSLLVERGELRRAWLTRLCADVADLREAGTKVVLVSSGAVALGAQTLGLKRKGLRLEQKQACAAVGQSRLTRGYDDALAAFGLQSAQALLTLEDTEDRRRYVNARNTLDTLLAMGVVPIVNENDTVATDEIRYGDNDRLAARTAQMVGADLLVLLSDIDGLYTADPRGNESAEHIAVVDDLTDRHLAMGSGADVDGVGSGGMATKLLAARMATEAGCDMIIADGREDSPLQRLTGGARHTLFKASDGDMSSRGRWIAGRLSLPGTLRIDKGAVAALGQGRSLLSVGVSAVDGTFSRGDLVRIVGPDEAEVARGLSRHDSDALAQLCGRGKDELDTPADAVVVHRDNMVNR